MQVEVVENHTDDIINALPEAIETALEMIGAEASGIAGELSPKDTGLLRNSMTYAIAGKPAKKDTYKASDPDKQGKIKEGSYEGIAPDDGEQAVFIGTNVEYAPYIEYGHHSYTGRHMIQHAIMDYADKYQKMAEQVLEGGAALSFNFDDNSKGGVI